MKRAWAAVSILAWSLLAAGFAGAAGTVTTHTLVNESVELHYRLYGAITSQAETQDTAEAKALVVLIHGWSCDASFWDAQITSLRERYAVLVLDLAGHGRSGSNRDDWSMTAFGQDVATVVATVATKTEAPIFLVGHSMGGPVAIEAARVLGQRVRAVVGVDTFKTVGLPPPSAAETAARLTFFERDFATATRLFVTQSFFVPGTDPAFIEPIAAKMAAAQPRVGIAAIGGLNRWDGVPAMRALGNLPIIALNAAHGAPTDTARLREFAPGFQAEVFEGVGHFLMMEDPERFNSRLLATLAALD
jgi:pimeloyl-ACP methyl ester carboxylesterase